MIQFVCPHCANPMRVADHAAGLNGTCRKCGNGVIVPNPASPPGPPPIVFQPVSLTTPEPQPAAPPFPFYAPAPSVTVINQRPQTSGSLGPAAIILAALAFVVCWIPLVSMIALPVAGFAAVLSMFGILLSFARSGRGMGFSCAALLLSGVAAFTASFTSGIVPALAVATARQAASRTAANSGTNQSAATPEPASSPGPAAIDAATEGAILPGVALQLTDWKIGPVMLEDHGSAGPTEKEYFQVTLHVGNRSQTKILKYSSCKTEVANLTDEHGNAYRVREDLSFSSVRPVGRTSYADIHPGEAISDTLVFARPVKAARTLFLTLKGQHFGETADTRFRIDLPAR